MKAFRVSGSFRINQKWQPFTKEVAAKKKTEVEELILSEIGSKHKVQRRYINIDSIEPMDAADVSDPKAKYRLEH